MLLTKRNLEIHALCSTDCTRPAINAVQITEQHTVATDGHVLIKVEQPDDFQYAEDYPIATDKKSDAMPKAGMLLDQNDAEHISKQMVKDKHNPLAGLCKVKCLDTKAQKIEIGVADPTAKREQILTYSITDDKYPDVDKVFPDGDVAMAHIKINVSNLMHVLSILRSYNTLHHSVDLFVPIADGNGTPIVIKALDDETNQKATALVMPLSHDGTDCHGVPLT